MPSERKKVQLRLEGANPMAFVEMDDEAIPSWTPAEEAAAAAVSEAIKSYIKTAESLSNGKYEHLRDKIPEYLVSPGNLLMVVCTDGVVIRYEKKSSADPRRLVAVSSSRIAEAAAVLSQNLVHIESDEASQPLSETFGVELQLSVHSSSQGKLQDIASSRIWFQAKRAASQHAQVPGAKPYSLLSVRNQLDLEIHGELADDQNGLNSQPFIVRSLLRLLAGWECIEVFPGLDLSVWNSAFAPLWAEHDLLGAVLIAQTKDAQLHTLDPRASARRQYSSLLSEFKALLDSNPDREQVLQAFLQANPILLCPSHVRMWPKLPLGATITDFVFREANQEYLLVELERSTLQLFRQDGHATADLTQAHGQIVDWKRYLEDNLQTVQRELGLIGITPNPNGLLVIGRSQSLLPQNRRKLQTMANESPKLRIMTYDDVYESARAVFENLLGPIWDAGGDTQIFYPSSC